MARRGRVPFGDFSHEAWLSRMKRAFKPACVFLACGSWSEPAFNPIPEAVVVNSGAPYTKPYDGYRHHYAKMAFTAAMAYALNRANEWDYLVQFDIECLLGALDLPKLFAEFGSRPEILLANQWCNLIAGGLMVFKREGAIRLLHHYPTGAFVDDDEPNLPIIVEQEWTNAFRNGRWWNPWQNIPCMIQAQARANSSDDEVMLWPTLYQPLSEAIVNRYIANHLANCVTL